MSVADGSPSTRVISVITTPLIVVSVVFPVLAAVSIYLRFVAKRRVRQHYHADDWWVIAAWVRIDFRWVPCVLPIRLLTNNDQFLTIPMSVLFWVFAAKSGVDDYDIDSVQGTYDSLEVHVCTGGIPCFPGRYEY